jgi:hypothetical protein
MINKQQKNFFYEKESGHNGNKQERKKIQQPEIPDE